MRYLYHNDDFGLTPTQRGALHEWIHKLELLVLDQAPIAEFRCHKRVSPEQIIQLVLLSTHLRDCGDLRKVVLDACKIVLPASIFSSVRGFVDDSLKIPSKGDLSRARLYIDVMHMLWWRCFKFQAHREGHVRYLAWDSSPQFGRDYKNIRRSIRWNNLRFPESSPLRLRVLRSK